MIQVANLVDLKTVYLGKGVPFILRAIISKRIEVLMLVTTVVGMSNKISLNILDSCIYTTSE